ncbi:hypothetical protein LWC05_05530 [Acetobacter sicerae]|uniref:Transposase n=1 Tax=Acetobacter sicerae TaxID=85325 RepID=A0ABS8VXS7_9PROT|nr:hypothetical protein [Acetobacter sicerae]MCE0743352.1 hypothetical protein [Acetobacter sicerae]
MTVQITNWASIDAALRHMAIVGLSIRQQSRKLGLSERAIYQRRSEIGLKRKDDCKRSRRAVV